VPIREEDAPRAVVFSRDPRRSDPRRYLRASDGTLTATYAYRPILDMGFPDPASLPRLLLKNALAAGITEPMHDLVNRWDAPFFYRDSRHVFYISTSERTVTVSEFQPYVGGTSQPQTKIPHIPPLVLQPKFAIPDRIGPVSVDQHPEISDPAPV